MTHDANEIRTKWKVSSHLVVIVRCEAIRIWKPTRADRQTGRQRRYNRIFFIIVTNLFIECTISRWANPYAWHFPAYEQRESRRPKSKKSYILQLEKTLRWRIKTVIFVDIYFRRPHAVSFTIMMLCFWRSAPNASVSLCSNATQHTTHITSATKFNMRLK